MDTNTPSLPPLTWPSHAPAGDDLEVMDPVDIAALPEPIAEPFPPTNPVNDPKPVCPISPAYSPIPAEFIAEPLPQPTPAYNPTPVSPAPTPVRLFTPPPLGMPHYKALKMLENESLKKVQASCEMHASIASLRAIQAGCSLKGGHRRFQHFMNAATCIRHPVASESGCRAHADLFVHRSPFDSQSS